MVEQPEKLTILSPHRDDAVFSLGLTLLCLSAKNVRLSVLNFFTISDYAPRSTAATVSAISEVRREEDLRALAAINPSIQEVSLNLLDAPLRGLPFDEILRPSTSDSLTAQYLNQLTTLIDEGCSSDLLLAPLGLGDHVDHISVRRAALQSSNTEVGFYEDLPYAASAPSQEFKNKVIQAEDQLHISLKPVLFTVRDPVRRKEDMALTYSSQIEPELARVIALFANSYGGAERLWIPLASSRWQELCKTTTDLF